VAETRFLQLRLPEDTPLAPEFEARLGGVLSQAFGPEWQLDEWYEVDEGADSQVFEFAFAPDHRTSEERLADFEARANQALANALPEINRMLMGEV
jgi:hypothetical protein